MSRFQDIRRLLGLKQAEVAEGIGVSQGTISFYENGKTIPPDVAERLLQFAAGRGHQLTFDHIYGRSDLPPAQPLTAGD